MGAGSVGVGVGVFELAVAPPGLGVESRYPSPPPHPVKTTSKVINTETKSDGFIQYLHAPPPEKKRPQSLGLGPTCQSRDGGPDQLTPEEEGTQRSRGDRDEKRLFVVGGLAPFVQFDGYQ